MDEDIWERAQELKKKRIQRSKRNTKAFYLLQGLLRCSECGFRFTAISRWGSRNRRNGKLYAYEYDTPRRYYRCLGMDHRLDGRKRPSFRAEQLEQLVWSEVKKVLQNPGLIMAGIESLDGQDNGGLAEEIARTERDLRNVQMEEDRAIRLYVTGKITEEQLDHQRKFITERLENLRAQLDEYRVREASGGEKRALLESVLAWAEKIGEGLDEISPHQRREMLQLVLDEVTIDRNNKVRIPLAIPVEDSVSIASQSSHVTVMTGSAGDCPDTESSAVPAQFPLSALSPRLTCKPRRRCRRRHPRIFMVERPTGSVRSSRRSRDRCAPTAGFGRSEVKEVRIRSRHGVDQHVGLGVSCLDRIADFGVRNSVFVDFQFNQPRFVRRLVLVCDRDGQVDQVVNSAVDASASLPSVTATLSPPESAGDS